MKNTSYVYLVISLIVGCILIGCASTPSQSVVDDGQRQEIKIRATRAALEVTATTSAISNTNRQNDLQFHALQENTEVSINVTRALGLILVIAVFILSIGLARHLVRLVEVRAITVRRDSNGQAPIFAIHEGSQWALHDTDRQVGPTTLLSMTPFAGQLKSGLTGNPETPATGFAPVMADPQQQIKITAQAQSVRLVLAANRDGHSFSSAKQALLESASQWGQPSLPPIKVTGEPVEQTTYRVVQLNQGEEDYIARLLPGYKESVQ